MSMHDDGRASPREPAHGKPMAAAPLRDPGRGEAETGRPEPAQAAGMRLESDRQRQAVLDALSAQIAVLDASGRIIAVNEAWRRFARENEGDATLEDGIGIDYFEACLKLSDDDPENLGEQACEGIRAVIAGRRAEFSLEYPCHHPEYPRWFLMTVTPLTEGLGGAVVAHLDISSRVRAEQESRQRREEVAHVARLSSVTVLAASLVHELAQPLAAASLFSESLVTLSGQDPVDRGQLVTAANDLRTQVDRAIGIVDGLRHFMRRGEIRTEVCELERPIRGAVSLVMPLARKKSVRLALDLPPEPVRVRVNPLQIEQVLVNLVCNGVEAIDRNASEDRWISIHLRAAKQQATVTVIDSGAGLSPKWITRIFEVFETEKNTGMGIGLAVSRTIVEAHGGRLWAEADGAPGAVMRFTLPLARDGGAV
ncbi:MAG: GHKL domain-containing protein [Thioalkalivibrio sp.]|nr:MAG: GHKL domain-containing protein [Thioalkalivibrio sp.]